MTICERCILKNGVKVLLLNYQLTSYSVAFYSEHILTHTVAQSPWGAVAVNYPQEGEGIESGDSVAHS